MVTTYAEVTTGTGALIGSAGHLEVAGNGVAVTTIGGPEKGDAVVVELE